MCTRCTNQFARKTQLRFRTFNFRSADLKSHIGRCRGREKPCPFVGFGGGPSAILCPIIGRFLGFCQALGALSHTCAHRRRLRKHVEGYYGAVEAAAGVDGGLGLVLLSVLGSRSFVQLSPSVSQPWLVSQVNLACLQTFTSLVTVTPGGSATG